MTKFSNRLRELRNSKDLSQQSFADKIGISKSSINMYERGEREPGLEMLESMADFFNVDLDYLLGKSDIPNKSLEASQTISEFHSGIARLIHNRRKELNLTLKDLSNYVGVSEGTVSRWENGFISNMKRDKIALLATALDVNPVSFISGELTLNGASDDYSPTVTEDCTSFPVIGEIAAGYDHIATEDWEGDTIDIPNSYLSGRSRTDFLVLRITGDSMYPLYHHGDKVLILKQSTLNESGDIGAIIYDNEIATLKKIEYIKGEDWLRLVPINPLYKPELIEGSRLEQCRIIGIPRLLIREFN